jgi:hypothetical protein
MKGTGSRLAIGGAGLAAACAVVCCSAPLLVIAVPGLALLIGGLVEAIEVGLIAAIVLGGLTAIGVLIWRRRHGTCSKGAECACGCRVDTSSPSAQLHWPVQRSEVSQ